MSAASVTAADSGAPARRGSGFYFVATLVMQACALLRYVVLARLLGPEQLGLAATLVITASFFDLISDTGSDRFLIQDRQGGTPEVQKLIQLVYAGRGVITAVALVALAIPASWFYHAPKLAPAFAILALSPLIMGFIHLDNRRAQRDHDFRSQAICMIVAEPASLIATIVATWLTREFTAILYGLIVRSLAMVVLSHVVARRPYRLGWDREHAPRLARFAAPLMLNGFLLFMIQQGDRVIVANQSSVENLGFYSAVILMILYPSTLIGSYLYGVSIPLIAAHRDSAADRERAIDHVGGQVMLLGLAMTAGFAVVAPPMIPILFGAKFTQPALLVGLIGVLQITRFILYWPTAGALAIGRSSTVLLSNLASIFAFAGALIGVRLVGGLIGIVGGFIAGGLIADAVAVALLNRNLGRGMLRGFDRLAAFVLLGALIVGWNLALGSGRLLAEAGMLLASLAFTAWVLRRESAVVLEAMATGRRLASPLISRSAKR